MGMAKFSCLAYYIFAVELSFQTKSLTYAIYSTSLSKWFVILFVY